MLKVRDMILATAIIEASMLIPTTDVFSETGEGFIRENKLQLPLSFAEGRLIPQVNPASDTSYQIPILEKGNRDMAIYRETFEGGDIEIKDDIDLSINGKQIDYEFDQIKNKFYSRYLPYTQYNSLLEMARAITKHTVEFSHVDE